MLILINYFIYCFALSISAPKTKFTNNQNTKNMYRKFISIVSYIYVTYKLMYYSCKKL